MHALGAAEAYWKIGIPSIADGYCCRGSTKEEHRTERTLLWASFARVITVKDLEQRVASTKITCIWPADCLAKPVQKFKKALESLPPVVVLRS